MLNYIWASLILIGLLVAGLLGRFTGDQGVITAALEMSKTAVMDIALPLAGMMMFWLGLMRLMEKAGLLHFAARALSPVMRRLFPDVPRDHPAMSAMIMNLAANMLGLGNNATPLGLKAMTHLQELNPHKDTASNAMVTFLAMNTAAFTLIPMTVINYLSAAGVKGAYQIIVPTILATACTTLTAIFVAKALQKLPMFRIRPGEGDSPLASRIPGTDPAAPAAEEPPAETPRITARGRIFLAAILILFTGGVVLELAAPSLRQSVLDATGLTQVIRSAEQRAASAKADAAARAAEKIKAAEAAKATAPATGQNTAPASATPAEDLSTSGLIRRLMDGASGVAIPLLVIITLGIALARRVKVYEEFVEGAKEGFGVATRIMPFLVAMLAALAIFRSSGALLLLEHVLTPVLNRVSFPVELLPMALMRPLSGSGSLGILNELLARNDILEYLKYTAAIMFGSTETTFYVLAVYFGSVSIRKTRHALAAGLTADLVGLSMSVVIGRLMFA
ncbi:nucleoside recognition domain-containing protein [Prosthecobacter dejongeii]|uniref:Spore maturation protein SpmA n=1 Tax=Prosthecobacter dejongeii TaxID=48465 RepID=A0A7W8DQS0_9BACT|nr:nucleoside recognition domain-containing protein [Prosthecobacter dejongeii]MBB5038196.1 spore maturation protein SpmA [Prosthecobacter dejongeii]